MKTRAMESETQKNNTNINEIGIPYAGPNSYQRTTSIGVFNKWFILGAIRHAFHIHINVSCVLLLCHKNYVFNFFFFFCVLFFFLW